ncbi:hypothetical protein [Spirosoma spitsbergense]|uniref:hypothetical protein n=1 Tax=Spirosoma spitsbergense TaxID=431554 RepID=UPI000475F94D|nr:hypothetical protein [Spirosoma spitsbergense]
MSYAVRLLLLLFPLLIQAQPHPRKAALSGQFLTDSVDIGRPFQYSLVYRHPAITDVFFPDTARNFAPYRVQKVSVFATQTTGSGAGAISRDSAVYTLVSFETDSVQLLKVPIQVIHETDCTAQWTQTDTVLLRSKLPVAALSDSSRPMPALLTETNLAPLQQQFNYAALVAGFLLASLVALGVYGLLGRTVLRYWQLFQLRQNHRRFLKEFNQLIQSIDALSASETARQAVMTWKVYLEKLDAEPYRSLTTPELADRMKDDRILNALREADRMIYGGAFSADSLSALRLLGQIATICYQRHRTQMQHESGSDNASTSQLAEKPFVP